ncbi:MAG: hypothetical protein WC718_12845 [Phycisphaerales bacterium]|jgi:hypothetical protein
MATIFSMSDPDQAPYEPIPFGGLGGSLPQARLHDGMPGVGFASDVLDLNYEDGPEFAGLGDMAADAAKWLGIITGVAGGASSAASQIAAQNAADAQWKTAKAQWETAYPGVPYPVPQPSGGVAVQRQYNPTTGQVTGGMIPYVDPRSFMEKYGSYLLVGGGLVGIALVAYFLLKKDAPRYAPAPRAAPAVAGLRRRRTRRYR